jgi:mRNA interferase MazF
MKRGEIRWYTFDPGQAPARASAHARRRLDQLGEIIAVPVTRTIRGLATELVLTLDDGMPVAGAANFDHVGLAQRGRIGALIAELRAERWSEVRTALLIACGFEAG